MTKLLTILLGCVAAASVATAADLQFRAAATPAGSMVTLGDVAQVSAANPSEAASLASVALFPAPVQEKTVYVEEILETLELRGVATGDLTATGSRAVSIGPASATVRPTAYSVAYGLAAPVAPTAMPAPPAASRVVALRDLQRDEIVRAEDVAVEPPSATVTTQGIVGGQLLAPVRAGHSVLPQHVQPAKLVVRGDAVEAIVAVGGITVTTRGIAEGDGALGERIVVRSLDRKRVFDGVVAGPHSVRVGGPQR